MTTRTRETHFLPFDTLSSGRKRRAACGRYVEMATHSNAPTCGDCAALKSEADALDAALEARAAALGLTVEELLFGAEHDPRDIGTTPDCPQVPR